MRTRFLMILVLLFAQTHVSAYIEALYSLDQVLEESTNIVVGRIESVDLRRRTAVAIVERSLKGRKDYERIQMAFGSGPRQQAMFMLELLEKGDPFIFYYEKNYRAVKGLAHCGNYWFQLFGSHHSDDRRMWWRFTHIEIYFPRTFAGTTPDLIQITRDVLSGKRRAPRANSRAPTINPRRLDVQKARRLKRGNSADDDTGVTLLAAGSRWAYHKGRSAPSPGSAWRQSEFDDSAWTSGRAPFGYGDPPFGTLLADMRGKDNPNGYTTLYLRRSFVLPPGTSVHGATCRVNYDDGFTIWVNGRRVVATNVPNESPAHDAIAPKNYESGVFETFDIVNASSKLVHGENTVAVQVLNHGLTSSDLKFDLELEINVEKQTKPKTPSETGRFTQIVEIAAPRGGEVRGISWVDVNGDELLDAYFCRSHGDLLLANEGDGFTNATRRVGLFGGSRSAAWADWDGDDHPDLLTSNFELYNNESGRLRRRTSLPTPDERNAEGTGWIDYNGDGRPDILVTNAEHGIVLLENTGQDRQPFRDVSRQAGFGPSGIGAENGDFVVFADFDGDGYTDFFYNLEEGLLAHNEGDGTFAVDRSSGLTLAGDPSYKRGLAAGDFDRDGDIDLFVPGPRQPALYRNENDGTFRNIINATGDLRRTGNSSVTAAWGDVDNDGNLDLFVAYTSGSGRLYLGDGAGLFRDATRAVGLHVVGRAHAASFADVDADGDLDLAVSLDASVAIYRNGVRKAPRRSGLEIRLHVLRGRIGSTIRVLDDEGNLLGLRQLSGADGCGGQQAPLAHVAVAEGRCRISVVLGDGRFGEKSVDAKGRHTAVTFREADFE